MPRNLNPVEKVVRRLSDDSLIANLNRVAAELDQWAVEGFDPDHRDLARERMVYRTLRDEFRRRSGEVV